MLKHLLFIYAILSFLVAGGLLFKNSGKAPLTLGVFILMLGLEILVFLYGTSPFINLYPEYYIQYYYLSGFIFGPLLLWHLQLCIRKSFTLRPVHALHLLPFLLAIIYLWDILQMSGIEKLIYIQENFMEVIMPLNYVRAMHLVTYGVVMIILLARKGFSLAPKERLYTWLITAIYFISCVTISWFTEFANTWRDFDVYYVITSTLTLLIGYLLYTDPDFLKQITRKYMKSTISAKDKKRISKKIEEAFKDPKLCQRNDLSLSDFALHIEEKSHHISQTFSEEINESFQEHLNRHRIELAKQLLTNPEYKRFTIEAIGQKAGFNNKVTFGQSFRKFAGYTPSQYRKENPSTNRKSC